MYLGRNCIRASSESAHQSTKYWNTYAEVSRCSHIRCRKSKRNDAFAIGSLSGIPSWRFNDRPLTIGRLHQPSEKSARRVREMSFSFRYRYIPLSRAVSLCFSRVSHRVPAWRGAAWGRARRNVARCRRSRDPVREGLADTRASNNNRKR